MGKSNLSKGIIIIFVTNIINMGFKVLINFLQPKLLSIETYSMVQTYMLYVSYAALLHFGFIDGMYLDYGGKNRSQIDEISIKTNAATLRLFQVIITIICLLVSMLLKNHMLILVTLTIIPANLSAYYRMLYQAIGEFDKYGRIMNIHTILLFLSNIILLFVIRSDQYIYYILASIMVYTIVWIILEYGFHKEFRNTKVSLFRFNRIHFLYCVSEGAPLTIGNLAATLLFSLDRWFVKIFLTARDFAYYSFAMNIQTFLNVAITPVTITLYNYFCNHTSKKEVIRIKNLLLVFASFIVSAVFPARIILEVFIKEYIYAVDILFVLFASKIFDIIIQGLFVNLYKANRMQKLYLSRLVLAIVIGLSINGICLFLVNTIYSYAIGTFITIVIWFIISCHDLPNASVSVKDFLYLLFCSIVLIVIGKFSGAIVGLLIYLLTIFIADVVLFKEEIKWIKNVAFEKCRRINHFVKGKV